MPQDLQEVLKGIRNDVMVSLAQTIPSREFGATMILALVGLHMTEAKIRKTPNLEERRRLIHEFEERRSSIQKGILALESDPRRIPGSPDHEFRRAVP